VEPTVTRLKARGRLNSLQRYRKPDDPDIAAARLQLREANLVDAIRREANTAPPFSTEQRARLAALLLSPGGGTNAAA
jgi:hypothetical protein